MMRTLIWRRLAIPASDENPAMNDDQLTRCIAWTGAQPESFTEEQRAYLRRFASAVAEECAKLAHPVALADPVADARQDIADAIREMFRP